MKGTIQQGVLILKNQGLLELLKRSQRFIYSRGIISLLYIPTPKVIIFKVRNKVNNGKYMNYPGIDYMIDIDPSEIRYRTKGRLFSPKYDIGRIRSGDWSKNKELIKKHPIWSGLHSRYVEGLDWQDTEYYEWARGEIVQKGVCNGYTDLDNFQKYRLKYIDRLYESLLEDGFQNDRNDIDSKRSDSHRGNILVNIAEDGELHIYEGLHRVILSSIIGIDKIPARVLVTHREWQMKREMMINENIDVPYSSHPDLLSLSEK